MDDVSVEANPAVAHESLYMQHVEEQAKALQFQPKLKPTDKLRVVLQNPSVLVFLFLLVLWDIALLVYSQVGFSSSSVPAWTTICSWIIISVFVVEVILRIIAYGRDFFYNVSDVIDAMVVAASFVMLIIGDGLGAKSVAAIRVLRVIRLIRVHKMCCRMFTDCQKGARHVTGENKKRFNMESFDLDITYIVGGVDEDGIPEPNQLIAMSVPATGWLQTFRNPISEVVRFFNTYHCPGKFKIYNACPELPYPSLPFGGDEFVKKFDIQDHTPPRMMDFVDFLADGWDLMNRGKNNVVVAHCRGGKGRTGSLCCAWLLYSQKKINTEKGPKICNGADALVYFAAARSDLSKSSKLQGVDTPSQKRYVICLDRLLQHNESYLSGPKEALKPPPNTEITLKALVCTDFFAKVPTGELVVIVDQAGDGGGLDWKEIVVSEPLPASEAVSRPFDLQGTKARGDIKISVYKKKSRDQAILNDLAKGKGPKQYIAGKEPGMLFYFIIHTAFLDLDSGCKRIGTDMMDKAFKDKKGKNYKPHNADNLGQGLVELTFEADAKESSLGDPFSEDALIRTIPESSVAGLQSAEVGIRPVC